MSNPIQRSWLLFVWGVSNINKICELAHILSHYKRSIHTLIHLAPFIALGIFILFMFCGYVRVQKHGNGGLGTPDFGSRVEGWGRKCFRCQHNCTEVYSTNVKSIGNFCRRQNWKNPQDSADRDTIFIRSDCATRELLPSDRQRPIYQYSGVPLDCSTANGMIGLDLVEMIGIMMNVTNEQLAHIHRAQ